MFPPPLAAPLVSASPRPLGSPAQLSSSAAPSALARVLARLLLSALVLGQGTAAAPGAVLVGGLHTSPAL